jgi:hypothetical protein
LNYEFYLAQYPRGRFAGLASLTVNQLTKGSGPSETSAAVPNSKTQSMANPGTKKAKKATSAPKKVTSKPSKDSLPIAKPSRLQSKSAEPKPKPKKSNSIWCTMYNAHQNSENICP